MIERLLLHGHRKMKNPIYFCLTPHIIVSLFTSKKAILFAMKVSALILAALPAATSAWASFSIANGLPSRRSVAKFTEDKVPEDAVTKAAEGKNREVTKE